MENVCRTCLDNRVTLVNIFSDVRDSTLDKPVKNLSYILSECTNRAVGRNDGKPQFICLSCVQAAQDAFRFKQQCDHSLKRFCQLQKKSSQDKNQNNQKAIIPEAAQKEAFRSIPCTPKSSRLRGLRTTARESSQSPNGTVRKQIQLPKTGVKLYGCNYCERSYKSKCNLKRHLVTHITKPKHKCSICSKVYWRRDAFLNHVRAHDRNGPHKCSQCSVVFAQAVQLEKHLRKHTEETVSGKYPTSDDLDSEDNDVDTSNGEDSFEPHSGYSYDQDNLRMDQNHHIGDTNLSIKSITLLREWQPQGLDLGRKSSKIDDSSTESSDDHPTSKQSESGFDQETTSSGQGEKYLKKRHPSYTDRNALKRHHSPPKPKYNCRYCSKTFWHKYRLTRHLRVHEEGGPLSCGQCTAVFIDAIHLERHRREHNDADDMDSEDTDIDMVNGETSLDASPKRPSMPELVTPRQAFMREDNLRFHKILKHRAGDKNPAENSTTLLREWEAQSQTSTTTDASSDDHPTSRQTESGFDQDTTSSGQGENQIKLQRFKCPYCSRTYKNKNGVQRHQAIHTQPKHQCSHCPKAFARIEYLRRHLSTHGLGREYSCNQCSATYSDKCSLRRHYHSAHEGRSFAKCSYCSKDYCSKDSLRRHERRKHSRELYRC